MSMIRPIAPGTRYGRLVVTGTGPRLPFGGQVRSTLICDCDCGKTGVLRQRDTLVRGHTKSCGCLAREHNAPREHSAERRAALVKLCARLVELERENAILRGSTHEQMLREFHEKLDVHGGFMPAAPIAFIPEEIIKSRLALMREEFRELTDAIAAYDIVKIADGLADLEYVLRGTGVVYGIPTDKVFAEVHRSNMTKVNVPGES